MKIKWGHGITNHIIQRIVKNMPHYYSHKNTEQFGKIEVTPNEWNRRIFKLGDFALLPYKVGDTIIFHLKLEKLPTIPYNYKTYVLEKTGNNQPFEINKEIKTNDEIKIEGEARWTGDTRFFLIHHIAPINVSHINQKELVELFYEDVHSLTSYLYGPVGIISTAIIMGVVGIIVGLILDH